MYVCFRGGTGDSRVARSISVIRGFTKNMKGMSIKAKEGSGGGHGRRSRRKDADGGDYKDGSGAASAKIAPAQLQGDEAYDGDDRRRDHELHSEQEKKEREKQEYCDKYCSPLLDDDDGGAGEKEGAREWVAEPEPGVLLTLSPRPDGSNRLRRVRFREGLFDAWAAHSWWADNHDRVVELYSVVQSDDDANNDDEAADTPVTPCQSEEEEALPDATTPVAESLSPSTSSFSGEPSSGSGSACTVGSPILGLVTAPYNRRDSKTPSTMTTTPRAAAAQQDDEEDVGDQQKQWREWVEEYEPGVFVTVRAYPDLPLQLRHVELSRERFGEVKARVWWQENKDRLRSVYSF